MARGKKPSSTHAPVPPRAAPGAKTSGARPQPLNTRRPRQGTRPDAPAPARTTSGPNTRRPNQGRRPDAPAPARTTSAPNTRRPKQGRRPDAPAPARTTSGPNTRRSAQGSRPGSSASPRAASGPNTFGPAWLATQLATLIPGYPNTPLCVALSGGVDSTALLAALASIHPRPSNLRALHVNHGLRPAARAWAQHCRALARRLRVPLQVLTTQVARPPGASLEAAARDARYASLAAALKPGEALLLAHHADDQLETVLLQLLRGSGLPGLSAMPAAAPFAPGVAVRPLLSRTRAELEAWVQGQGLTWIEDDSNADETLNRNYLRRQILPLIQARWPSAAAAVARSARHVAEAQSLLERLARTDIERAGYGESLSVKTLRALPPDRLNNALRFWIARAGLRVPDTRRLAEICGPLLKAREDANPFVEWGEEGARVQRQGDLLTLTRRPSVRISRRITPTADSHSASITHAASDAPAPGDDSTSSAHSTSGARPTARSTPSTHSADVDSEPARVDSPSSARSPDLVWPWRDSSRFDLPHPLGKLQLEPDPHGPVDMDALPHPLIIRWRRGGERLAPRRGGPRRALKSLLQESRVPASERQELPLLFAPASSSASPAHDPSAVATASGKPVAPDAEKLLAVADLLLDETVQATSATRRRARLRWVKSPR